MGAGKSKINKKISNQKLISDIDNNQHQDQSQLSSVLQPTLQNKLTTVDSHQELPPPLDEEIKEENYEDLYRQLAIDHQQLQNEFLGLKSKLIKDDHLNRGDFSAYADDLSHRINEIIYEENQLNQINFLENSDQNNRSNSSGCSSLFDEEEDNNDDDEIVTDLSTENDDEQIPKNNRRLFTENIENLGKKYQEKVDDLKKEQQILLNENEFKNKEIQNLQSEIESMKIKLKNETEKLKE